MRIRFYRPVYDIFQDAVRLGAGHHWSIAYGELSEEFALLSSFLGIEYRLLS